MAGRTGRTAAASPASHTLTGQDADSRRQTLERIFRTTHEHPEDLTWTLGPGQVRPD
jgi:hypothetical protein